MKIINTLTDYGIRAAIYHFLYKFFDNLGDWFLGKYLFIERDYCKDCGIEGGYGHRAECVYRKVKDA